MILKKDKNMTTINQYLTNVEKKLATGMAREHAHRPLLEGFLKNKIPNNFEVINDGKRIECGQPDLVIYKKAGKNYIDIGYIEAKDIGINLDKEEKSKQLTRYKDSLENLILTDYLEFQFFIHGKKVAQVRIAECVDGKITPLPDNFSKFETLLEEFLEYKGQTIKSSEKLAEMMAKKARLMKEVFQKAVESEGDDNLLIEQFEAFKKILIHDLTYEQFADVYAQTITYGLFTARIHDETIDDFSRQEARDLIPRSNPFLRQLFDYISGANLDTRVVWIVDALCEVLRLTNKESVLKEFGFKKGQEDPIIHFYETFLAKYDPKLRKSRGVWYTPEPVVNFIVRAIDDCLKKYFNLPDGIASKDKVKVKLDEIQSSDKRTKSGKVKKEVEMHKVQLLDVATGTGTFIAEAIKQIYDAKFVNQKGMWSSYVDEHLLPRLHGFEILMASYAMCHLKIDLLLENLGYQSKNPNNPKRLGVYLTNSLEEAHEDTGTLFASWLSKEATEANHVKRDMPVMVAFGNPPYSVSSSNKGAWIQNLIKDYKTGLNERKINLDDDYIKFIRYAEHYIEKTGFGVVGMITNNSFIDGITHRQMRKHLLETFDDIYIYDLHGSAKKKEKTPDGKPDKNVFDIMQGVSISIFVKHKKVADKKKLATVYHYDSYGSRKEKYDSLWEHSLKTTPFKKLDYKEPYYFFVPKDFSLEKEYEKGIKISELMNKYSSGIETQKDGITIKYSMDEIEKIVQEFKTFHIEDLKAKYSEIRKDGRDWKLKSAISDLKEKKGEYRKIQYKPFDFRCTYYTGTARGFIGYPRHNVMKNFSHENMGLCLMRKVVNTTDFKTLFITNTLMDKNFYGFQTYCFPLYLYPQGELTTNTREPNLNHKIVADISKKLGIKFIPDHEDTQADGKTAFSPLDLLDYIYAVLHSPSYRTKYKEFLKIDFPRIPYPTKSNFWKLVSLGSQIRQLHLMESPVLNTPITSWNIDGDNIVEKPVYKDGRVYINATQYFDNVPETAWNFYIGGYQPAQKWLKDRKSRTLNYDDLEHYQKIITALCKTDKLMQQVDEVMGE